MSEEPFPGSAADFYERIQEYKGIGERLRESDERLSGALEEIERLKTIITELCDALQKVRQSFDFIDRSTWDAYGVDDVIQRAREATQ